MMEVRKYWRRHFLILALTCGFCACGDGSTNVNGSGGAIYVGGTGFGAGGTYIMPSGGFGGQTTSAVIGQGGVVTGQGGVVTGQGGVMTGQGGRTTTPTNTPTGQAGAAGSTTPPITPTSGGVGGNTQPIIDSGTADGGPAAGSGGSSGGGGDRPLGPDCIADSGGDYGKNGTIKFTTKVSGAVNMYIPTVPDDCKVPMIHLANGTGGNCLYYGPVLQRLASHGFMALCYENTNTGAGEMGMTAYDTALKQYPDLIDKRIGSTGHSQGGMASLVTLQYAEAKYGDEYIYAGFAIEPASGFGSNPKEAWATIYGRIYSPTFMFSGLGTDTLVSQGWVQMAFDAVPKTTETYFWTKAGANHIATMAADTNEVIASWFRWQLLADTEACEYFKQIPKTNSTWAVAAEKNAKECDE